jgi:cellobiose transport system substrate-binding protein
VSSSRRTTAVAFGAAAALTLLASGCSSSSPSASASAAAAWDAAPITLTLATFNNFGYDEAFLAGFKALHPNVTINHTIAATSNDARANFFTKLGAGSGLADVEAVEIDWFSEMMQYSDKLADLSSPSVEGRWIPWKSAAATDANGRLIGYGTDIGPEAICYRSDLFAAAGLPTDRTEVAALLKGDWAKYFSVGEQFVAASPTKAAWFDSAGATYQGMINQVTNAYEKNDGTLVAATNPDVKKAYDDVLAASATLSAHLGQWGPDWNAGIGSGAFATMLCPGWMLGVISGNAEGVVGWDVADVFPGGGGNWGGSYLTVPAQGKNIEGAKALADWITAPEQQIAAFQTTGNFPSQVAAYTDPALTEFTNAFFNNAPVGKIFAARAAAVNPVPPFKGANYFKVNDALQKALTRVDVDGTDDIASSWAKFLTDVAAIG